MEKKKVKKTNKTNKTLVKIGEKRFLIYGAIYLICSVLWFVIGYIKMDNKIDIYYLDYICGVLLLVLSVVYFVRYKLEK